MYSSLRYTAVVLWRTRKDFLALSHSHSVQTLSLSLSLYHIFNWHQQRNLRCRFTFSLSTLYPLSLFVWPILPSSSSCCLFSACWTWTLDATFVPAPLTPFIRITCSLALHIHSLTHSPPIHCTLCPHRISSETFFHSSCDILPPFFSWSLFVCICKSLLSSLLLLWPMRFQFDCTPHILLREEKNEKTETLCICIARSKYFTLFSFTPCKLNQLYFSSLSTCLSVYVCVSLQPHVQITYSREVKGCYFAFTVLTCICYVASFSFFIAFNCFSRPFAPFSLLLCVLLSIYHIVHTTSVRKMQRES